MDASVLESSTGVMKIDTGHHRIKFQETVRLSWANPVGNRYTPTSSVSRCKIKMLLKVIIISW